MAEFDPAQHEQDVADTYERLGKYALFDELVDYALDGHCSLDEAIAQFKHDLHIQQGLGIQ
jgi:hypothetical protein